MADISIQFHAVPDELLAFAKAIVADFGVHVVAMRFSPFEAIEVNPARLDEIVAEGSPYHQLGFTVNSPELPATGAMNFLDKNPGALRLTVERANKEGLRQSLLTARASDPAVLSIWEKVAKRLKEMTKAGVVVSNPDTGKSTQNRTHRYSAGAKALAASGVPMLPLAGGNRIEFSASANKAKSHK